MLYSNTVTIKCNILWIKINVTVTNSYNIKVKSVRQNTYTIILYSLKRLNLYKIKNHL